MNTAKEKKLKDIRSDILEITEFLTYNKNESSDFYKSDKINNNSNDTLTLTNIVDSKPRILSKNELTEIKNEIYKLKSMLTNQEVVLKEILSKIK